MATTIMATPSVWVQLYYKGEEEPSGRAIKIQPIPEDIDALIDAVKQKLKPKIDHVPVDKILVYPAGTSPTFSEDNDMDPGDAVPGGTTSKNPLIVVAPDPTSRRRAEDTLVGEPTLKKPRNLNPFDFKSMAVLLEEVSLPEYNDENMPDFIAPEDWLNGILELTITNANRLDAHHPKVVPTALTRISRGGKSRSLQELALAITDSTATSAYRIIKISFNTDTPIEKWEQKNPLAALCLRIAFAARKDTSAIFQRFKLSVNVAKEAVEGWLGQGTKCILMIDELNRLNQDPSVAEFLKNNFLIPAGRGLVFTSHVVTLNNTLCSYMDSASNREIISVKLPDVVSLADTRTKLGANSSGEGASSSTLSPQHIVYLGKIPALIHTYLSPAGALPQKRRGEVVQAWLVSSEYNVRAVKKLLSSMISGHINEVPACLLEFMDIDRDVDRDEESNYVRWVPYHMRYIISSMAGTSILTSDMSTCLGAIATLFGVFKDSKVQSGDSWEALFLIVLLVRCLTRQFDDTILPLVDVPDEVEIRYNKPYIGEHFYSENPSEFIGGIPLGGSSSISLYWPGHAKFENYDIVVAEWDNRGQRSLYGYQCKEGSNLPRPFANEEIFNHCYVIRGAAVAQGQSLRRWKVPEDKKLQEFFGVSSTHWSPQAWKALKDL